MTLLAITRTLDSPTEHLIYQIPEGEPYSPPSDGALPTVAVSIGALLLATVLALAV